MKKCKKCGKVFEDEALFCSHCGEKLVDENSCPRCGSPVEPDDLFCSHCGFDLKNANKCKKCGAEIKNGSKFCPKCGEPLDSHQIIDTKAEPKSRSISISHSFKNIFTTVMFGLFCLLSVLMITGFFGKIVKATYLIESADVGVKYFFGDGAKQLDAMYSIYKVKDYYNYERLFFVIHSIFYFGGIASLLASVAFGIYKGIKSILYKEEFKRKYFMYLIFSALPYVMFTSLTSMSTDYLDIKITFGWGTTMLIISMIFALVAYIASYVTEGVIRRKNFGSRIVSSVVMVLLLFLGVFGVTKQASLTNAGVTINLSTYNIGELVMQSYSAGGLVTSTMFNNCIGSLIFTFLVFALIPIGILCASNKSATWKIITVITAASILVFSIFSTITAAKSLYETYAYGSSIQTGIGSGAITAIILSTFATIFSILALIIKLPANDQE